MTQRCLAILTVRNEAAYLLEWLAHHRAVGFTDFLVFSNDCTDGTDTLLDRLHRLGHLTHVRNPGPFDQGPQWAALKQADKHPLKAAADWLMFLDIDEFVNIHVGDHTLSALLHALPDATAIPLTWRFFGNAGIIPYTDRPVTRTFTRAAPAVLYWPWRAALFKTLFRNDGTYRKLGVHRPRSLDASRLKTTRWFDGSGRELPELFHTGRIFSNFGQDNYQLAQLNHYALGAMESYIVKADRGRANVESSGFDMSYWVERNFCQEPDATITVLPNTLADLHADPETHQLHLAAVAWRHATFQALMLHEPYRALFGRLMMTPATRALPLTEAQFLLAHARRAADIHAILG